MRFIIDNALSWRLARDLCKGGHDAVHVSNIGLANADDEEIFLHAQREARFIITTDVDLEKLLARSGASQPSIVLLRTGDERPGRQATMLLTALPSLESDLTSGAYIIITDEVIHIHRLA